MDQLTSRWIRYSFRRAIGQALCDSLVWCWYVTSGDQSVETHLVSRTGRNLAYYIADQDMLSYDSALGFVIWFTNIAHVLFLRANLKLLADYDFRLFSSFSCPCAVTRVVVWVVDVRCSIWVSYLSSLWWHVLGGVVQLLKRFSALILLLSEFLYSSSLGHLAADTPHLAVSAVCLICRGRPFKVTRGESIAFEPPCVSCVLT